MSADLSRARGLVQLLRDAVVHGATAIERVHMATAQRPFVVLEAIPVVAGPTRVVHAVHDGVTASVYGAIRLGARAAAFVADAAVSYRRPVKMIPPRPTAKQGETRG